MTENSKTIMLLNISQAALQTALEELDSAKKMLQWSRDKLVEAQDENRKLANLLLRFTELPDPVDCSELLDELDKPCGFQMCKLSKDAAKLIRSYAASNSYLRAEVRRLKGESNANHPG